MIEREGKGWRLAWDGSRQPFSVLMAGEGWAAELTEPEAEALRDAVRGALDAGVARLRR